MNPEHYKRLTHKIVKTPTYNYYFDVKTGNFARWGTSMKDDPYYSPIGPEILDIEVSTVCTGLDNVVCRHCYKANTGVGDNMTLDMFKNILDKMPTVMQIAFGIGDIDSNPDLFDMFEYCIEKDVVPNVTINGDRLTDELVDKLTNYCGAISVSRYSEKDYCYNAIEKLVNKNTQINIHALLSVETYDMCIETINDSKTDVRLKDMNAIVFLMYKPKGRGVGKYTNVTSEMFGELVDKCMVDKVPFGFDSCGAPMLIDQIEHDPTRKSIEKYIECCESTLFSSYINVKGEFYPCSFVEGEEGWKDGINVVYSQDFLNDVWYADRVKSFRRCLTCQGIDRKCPVFDIYR